MFISFSNLLTSPQEKWAILIAFDSFLLELSASVGIQASHSYPDDKNKSQSCQNKSVSFKEKSIYVHHPLHQSFFLTSSTSTMGKLLSPSQECHPFYPSSLSHDLVVSIFCCCACLLVMLLPPERFAEVGRIDFHLHSFGNARRVVRVCLFMGFIFPNLPLRLPPVLNCSTVLAASLLV